MIVRLRFVLSSISSLIWYILSSKDQLRMARLDTSNNCSVADYIIVGYNCIHENFFDPQEAFHRHIQRSFPSLFLWFILYLLILLVTMGRIHFETCTMILFHYFVGLNLPRQIDRGHFFFKAHQYRWHWNYDENLL